MGGVLYFDDLEIGRAWLSEERLVTAETWPRSPT